MRIYYFSPYSSSKNFGEEANRYCSLVPNNDDWICLRDGDSLLFDDWGSRIEQIIADNPDGDIFGCTTNRLRYPDQLYENKISDNPDILYHKKISDKLWRECGTVCVDAERAIAGLFLLFRKSVWQNIKFHDGLFRVDYLWATEALEANYKIKIMMGLYCFHYYRFAEGVNYQAHLF